MNIWKWMVLPAGMGLVTMFTVNLVSFAGTHSYSTEVENGITTGDIAISLEEYELDAAGNEILYQDGKCVLPGQTISKIVRIENEADTAWIRARVEYQSKDNIEDMSDELLGGIGDNWVKRGAYFYYLQPVSNGENVDLFREITIPSEWDSRYAGQEFQVAVTAQAIQEANFIPDFSSEFPWYGVPVEVCVHSDRTWDQGTGRNVFEIIFENGTEGFVKSSEDFFEGFSAMMPGDTVTGTMEFGNHFGRRLDISFRSEVTDEQSEESLKLLDDLQLVISDEDTVLYKGSLGAADLHDGMVLINGLGKGESRGITYTLHMPEELANVSALKEAKVKWIFSTSYTTSSGGGGSSSGGVIGSRAEAVSQMVAASVQQVEEAAQEFYEYLADLPGTGDTRNGGLLVIMLISGSAAFLLSSGNERGKQSEEEREHE